jgi:GPI mannosyltransferase 3
VLARASTSVAALLRLRAPLLAALAFGALPAALAVAQLGRLHPDEVYQSLEPAFWRVHGYGVLAWEWKAGLRNWAVPLALAGLLRLAGWLGLQDPWTLRGLIALPIAAFHALALLAAFRLGERQAPRGGWAALLALGLLPMAWAYAGRTLSEPLSAAALVLAAEALERPPGRWRSAAWGGLALGLAVVARYGSVPAVAGALAWLTARRRWGVLGGVLAGGAAVALLLGALDWATWGEPFHSLVAWARFNVFSDAAERAFGATGPLYYPRLLLGLVPLWVWPVLLYAAVSPGAGRPRLGVALAMALTTLVALLATPHKEERFLYPVVVLLVLEAAPALTRVRAGLPLLWSAAAAALAVVLTLASRPTSVDPRGDEFRALVRISREPDTTGLLIVNEGLWGAGGYFYIGKEIPWLTCDFPTDSSFRIAMVDGRFNRAITFEGRALEALRAAGFRVTGEVGRETLLSRPAREAGPPLPHRAPPSFR